MRLRNIFEGLKNEVAIIFGRFNPPHKGHRAAWELASKSPIWYVGTNQSTVGPKDPLPYDVKVEAMKTIWPEVEGHIIAETSWLTLASLVYEKHGDVHLLCFTDEDWVTKTILQYNGKEGPHGFYNFKRIDQRPTPRLSSATALRDAVAKGDREAFSVAAGVDADTPVGGQAFFDLVAEYLMPYQNAPKKVAKKKTAAPVEGVAEDTSADLRSAVYEVILEIYKGAKDGNEMIDTVADELGDYFDAVQNSDDEVLKKAYAYVRNKGADAEDDPELMAQIAFKAIQFLNSKGSQGGTKEGQTSVAEGLPQTLRKVVPGYAKREIDKKMDAGKFGKTDADKDANFQRYKKIQDKLKEFALGGDDGGEEDTLLKFARMWYNGDDDTQQKVEQALARQGWEIGELESEEGGAFVIRAGDENGDSYIGFAVADLTEDAAGVGIITKQNSTVDVNKGTPRKNLKAFRLIK